VPAIPFDEFLGNLTQKTQLESLGGGGGKGGGGEGLTPSSKTTVHDNESVSNHVQAASKPKTSTTLLSKPDGQSGSAEHILDNRQPTSHVGPSRQFEQGPPGYGPIEVQMRRDDTSTGPRGVRDAYTRQAHDKPSYGSHIPTGPIMSGYPPRGFTEERDTHDHPIVDMIEGRNVDRNVSKIRYGIFILLHLEFFVF